VGEDSGWRLSRGTVTLSIYPALLFALFSTLLFSEALFHLSCFGLYSILSYYKAILTDCKADIQRDCNASNAQRISIDCAVILQRLRGDFQAIPHRLRSYFAAFLQRSCNDFRRLQSDFAVIARRFHNDYIAIAYQFGVMRNDFALILPRF
jgi:hypothetical protein